MPADTQPLVSVICLCYNHASYVVEALDSVVRQTYSHWELIIWDDASTDHSAQVIEAWIAKQSFQPVWVRSPQNQGNCRSFNHAFAMASGSLVIDLAADDVLLPNRLEQQVALFNRVPNSFGVVYSNAWLLNQQSERLGTHFAVGPDGKSLEPPPSGNIYRSILARQWLPTPTMMIRREVLEQLGGYDPELSYEDFDFWVRSAPHYQYAYLDACLTGKRVVHGSHGKQFYKKNNRHLHSTLAVCHKAFQQNQHQADHLALAHTVRYYLRVSALSENRQVGKGFFRLLGKLSPLAWHDFLWWALCHLWLPTAWAYRGYLWLRYRIS